jgi:chaperonin cofactor prefoldin
MARLEGSYEQLDKRLASIEHRLDRFEDDVKARFDALDRRFEKLDAKIDARFNTLAWLSGGFGLVIVALQLLTSVGVLG